MNVFTPLKNPSSWRRLALATWNKPGDPSVYGGMTVECTRLIALIESLNKEGQTKITITHAVAKALALTLRKYPDINGIIKWGKIYVRESVDIFLQVAVPEKKEGDKPDLSGAKISHCDQKTLRDIAEELAGRAKRIRDKGDSQYAKSQGLLNSIPSWLLKPLMKSMTFLTFNFNLNLPKFGLPHDPFGSAMVTSVATWGVPPGYPPLVPFSRVPLLVCVGAVEQKPWVIDGQVVARPVMELKFTFDHRFMDGLTGGRMYKYVKGIFENPEEFLK